MERRFVKETNEAISILGYGGMRFPTVYGKIDEKKAMRQLRYAIDQGVNYIDTAYFYHGGQSEAFIGRALKDGYREKVNIATKMPPWLVNTPEDLTTLFNTQCQRLQTDVIDYYLLHALNGENWERFLRLDALSFLTKLKDDGRIRKVGFSFHGDRQLFKTIVDAYPWDFCQIQYNILDTHNQAGTEGLHYAHEKGLAVFVMEPLRGGSLAGKLPKAAQSMYQNHPNGWSPVQWALNWLWHQPEVTMVLSGMTEDAHLEENLRIAKQAKANMLSDDELSTIERVVGIYKTLQKVPCTACQYCMPCPFGVDIPRCFDLYNSKYLLNQKVKTFYWMQLGGMNDKPSHASLCTACGLCVKKCPQSIDIPNRLKDVAKDLEGRFMAPAVRVGKFFVKNYKKSK